MRAVVFAGAGGPEVVSLQERPDPEPGTDDVLVTVRYAGLNPADSQQRQGRYPAPPGAPPDIPGLEVAGTVLACGSRVTAWRPGDRVFGLLGGGGLADRVAVHERCVTRVPDALSERDAAAVPEAFITAHDAAFSQAGLRLGETVLVHGAAGGVGTAAVQLAVAAGARPLAVVRSDEAAEAVSALGAEVVREDAFPGAVADATGGAGADVILELVGAPHFPANLEALALKGRVMVVGVAAGSDATVPLLALMRRRATVRGTVLRTRPLEEKAAAVRAFEREVVPQLAAGRVRPIVDSEFPADQAAAAFERLDGRGKFGKVLLRFS